MKTEIPNIKRCLALIDCYGMLENIKQHSFVVARVAETIVTNLEGANNTTFCAPDLDLVLAGALLHDIAKTKCLDGSCRHAEEGEQICIDLGYPGIGAIVGEHVILKSFTPETYKKGIFGAREIVYYSDKRVNHTSIVSLHDRLDYIIERYGDGSSYIEHRIRDNFQHCLDLEQYLFSFLSFSADELADHVKATPFT